MHAFLIDVCSNTNLTLALSQEWDYGQRNSSTMALETILILCRVSGPMSASTVLAAVAMAPSAEEIHWIFWKNLRL